MSKVKAKEIQLSRQVREVDRDRKEREIYLGILFMHILFIFECIFGVRRCGIH